MVPPIQAIISDVDGTLMPFATSTKLSKRNMKALALAVEDYGCSLSVATGRIPGPWYDALCRQMPFLGAGVFCNGALVLKDGEVLAATPLPATVVAPTVQSTSGGRVAGGRIGVLAVTEGDEGYEYLELAPDGPSWVTKMIERAGEQVRPIPSYADLLEQEVFKVVMFTKDDEDWAAMDEVLAILREVIDANEATILDCGGGHCEILPPGVNKGWQFLKITPC